MQLRSNPSHVENHYNLQAPGVRRVSGTRNPVQTWSPPKPLPPPRDTVVVFPLYTALKKNAPLEVVNALITAWPNAVKTVCERSCLPLHIALKNGASLEVVGALIAAWPDAVKEVCGPNCYALHLALKYNAPLGVVNALIDVWPDVVKVVHDSTIQPKAVDVGNVVEIAFKEVAGSVIWHVPPVFGKLLAIAKADEQLSLRPSATKFRVEVTQGNSTIFFGTVIPNVDARHLRKKEQCTLLRFSLMHGVSLDVLKALIVVHPGAVALNDIHGDTPVHTAVKTKQLSFLQCLTDAQPLSAQLNAVFVENKEQHTPLDCALEAACRSEHGTDNVQNGKRVDFYLEVVRAKFNKNAQDAEHLVFRKGDLLNVYEKHEPNWCVY